MRFFNRSHREGPLGAVLNDATQSTEGEGNLLEQYPNLPEVLGLSDPLHYQPGDVTVHHGYCIHGSPDNTTDKPRWSYLFSVSSHRPVSLWVGFTPLAQYSPTDTRYFVPEGQEHGSAGNHGSQRRRLGDGNPIVGDIAPRL